MLCSSCGWLMWLVWCVVVSELFVVFCLFDCNFAACFVCCWFVIIAC